MERIWLFTDEGTAAVTPMAKPRPEEGPATVRTRYQSRASSSQRTLDQLPDDNQNPVQVDSPSIVPVTAPVIVVPTTQRRNRTAPSPPDARVADKG